MNAVAHSCPIEVNPTCEVCTLTQLFLDPWSPCFALGRFKALYLAALLDGATFAKISSEQGADERMRMEKRPIKCHIKPSQFDYHHYESEKTQIRIMHGHPRRSIACSNGHWPSENLQTLMGSSSSLCIYHHIAFSDCSIHMVSL